MLYKAHCKKKHIHGQADCLRVCTTVTYFIAVPYPDLDYVISAGVRKSQLLWGRRLPIFSSGHSQLCTIDLPKQRDSFIKELSDLFSIGLGARMHKSTPNPPRYVHYSKGPQDGDICQTSMKLYTPQHGSRPRASYKKSLTTNTRLHTVFSKNLIKVRIHFCGSRVAKGEP
jgi:hypothetical protein